MPGAPANARITAGTGDNCTCRTAPTAKCFATAHVCHDHCLRRHQKNAMQNCSHAHVQTTAMPVMSYQNCSKMYNVFNINHRAAPFPRPAHAKHVHGSALLLREHGYPSEFTHRLRLAPKAESPRIRKMNSTPTNPCLRAATL